LFWPFLFGQKNVDQAQVVEQRIEKIDEQVKEKVVVENKSIEATETTRKITPVAPVPKKQNQIRNTAPVKKKPATRPQNNNAFTRKNYRGIIGK